MDITKAKQQRLGDTIIFNFILTEKQTYPADTTLTMSFRLSLTEGVST